VSEPSAPTTRRCSLALTALAFTALAFALMTSPVTAQEEAPQRGAPRRATVINQSTNPLLAGFRFRSIGPAAMGGRVDDVEVAPSDPNIVYIGFATGGVWKSVNNTMTFVPVFDTYQSASIGDIAIHPTNPDIVYVGTGEQNNRQTSSFGDGVYKTTDGGKTFTNIGLKGTQTIARILIDPRNPDVVYVAAPGHLYGPNTERGLYKSSDGGKSWTKIKYIDEHTGFTDVVFDPSNTSVLYAASYQRLRTGCCFNGGGPGSALWKSIDAGKSWTKLTGPGLPAGHYGRLAIDVSRSHPNVVYAQIEAGEAVLLLPGDAPGLVREMRPQPNAAGEYWTTAGGDAARYWCNNGAIPASARATTPRYLPDPNQGGVFRSDDGGRTWKHASNCNERPLYFSQLRVDPRDPNTVYTSGGAPAKSTDGGRTFTKMDVVHADQHAMWIDPTNPKHLIVGNDGGINISYDQGETWDLINTMATAQAYSVAADNERPYNVFIGLQDNGTWGGPSSKRGRVGIINSDWFKFPCVGDGFVAAVNPREPTIAYCESQDGAIQRVDLAAGRATSIRPVSGPFVPKPIPPCDDGRPPNNPRLLRRGGPRTVVNATAGDVYRFSWNAPYILSPHNPDVVYLGGNRLFRSADRGDTWTASPDLTKQVDRCKSVLMGVSGTERQLGKNDGVEWYSTIVSVAESPVTAGIVWAGTDDGNLQVSRDSGRTFTDVSRNLPGLPPDHQHWIARIEASHFDGGSAYIAVDGHRSDDMRPYLFVTRDFGATFHPIASNLPEFGNVLVVREDPKNRNLLFVGTEFGLFASLDGGKRWERFMNDFPTVRTDDILIHPRDGDLIVATHGRSVLIADDITPLQQLTPDVLAQDAHLFVPRQAIAYTNDLTNNSYLGGVRHFVGENAPPGGAINYYLRFPASADVGITVSDSRGRVIGSTTGPSGAGIHRLAWARLAGPGGGSAPRMAPGSYTVTLDVGGRTYTQTLEVLEDRWFDPR
jgi:photosystem II stability/assembly factor-like uncharacterized protein